MKYPILIGIFLLSLLPLMSYGIDDTVPYEDNNLIVGCGPLSGNLTLDCIHKIPDIDPAFLDATTISNSDQIQFEALGGTISNACNPVVITVDDVIIGDDPSDCMDTYTVIRTYTIDDQSTQATCVTTYEIVYAELAIISFGPARLVECSENVDSIFNEWIEDLGGTEVRGCANVTETVPAVPIIAYDRGCINTPSSFPNERGNIRLEWKIEDDCGVRKRAIASFVVVDNTPPEITCPDNVDYAIEDPDLFSKIENHLEDYSATEQCGNARVEDDFTMSDVIFDCSPVQQIPVVFTARDTCDNISTCQLIISIINDAIPDIICPDDITIECGDQNNRAIINNWSVDAQATDYASMALPVQNNFDTLLLEAPFCGQTTEITFTTELCGRTNSCSSNVTIIDTQKPIITCPSDTIFFSSEPDITAAANLWLDNFIAIDACGGTTRENDLDVNDLLFSCDPTKDVFVTFVAEDACQNDTTCMSKITIESDYTATISCGGILELQCGDPNNITLLEEWIMGTTATDNVNSVLQVESDINIFDPRLTSCSGTISVTFTAVDLCGGQSSCPSFIMMMDDEAPVITTCPDDITFDSSVTDLNGEIDNWLASIVATDNCAPPIIDNDYDPSSIQGCDLSVTVSVEHTAMDSCGLMATPCINNLTINTDRLPTVTCADRLLVNCNDSSNDALITTWLQATTGSDFNGNDLTVVNDYVQGSIDYNQCLDSLDVKFRIIDNCLYEDSCIARIVVADTIPPSIVCPSALAISSTQIDYQVILDNWLTVPTSDDSCMPGIVSTDFDPTLFIPCDADEITEVIFSVTDGCNNTSSCTAIINVDKSLPTIDCPANDLVLQCGNSSNDLMIDNWIAQVSGSDNNGTSRDITSDYDPENLKGDCSIATLITFEVIDTCGQINNCTKIISLTDDLGPVIDCPAELNLSAGAPNIEQTVEDFLSGILIEDCNSFEVTDDLDRSLLDFMCGDELVIPVVVTALDSCSNSSNCSFDITISNSVVSSITCAQDTTIECGNPDNALNLSKWLESATAFDSDNNQFLVTNDLDVNSPQLTTCTGSVPVVFMMVDNCNTSLSCNAIITITDTTVPEIFCPTDTAFVFGTPTFDNDVSSWLSSVTGNDNCLSFSTDDDFNNNYTIDDCLGFVDVQVVFTAQDDCGLTSDCSSVLTIRSERAPIINCPADLTVECGDNSNIAMIEAWRLEADGFDFDGTELTVTSPGYSEADFLNLNCNEDLIVTFVMTNSCGLDISCDAVISLADTTPPQLTCPQDITVNATDAGAETEITAWLSTAISVDACSSADLIFDMTLDFSNLCQAADIIEVPFTATDECGLVSNCSAVIFVNKESPIINCPTDILNLECGDNSIDSDIQTWLSQATGIDNNGIAIQPSNDFLAIDITDICVSENVVTFSVTDACGQENTCSQQINVLDTEVPVLTCPVDVEVDVFSATLSDDVDSWLASFSATDACSAVMINNNFTADINSLDCGEAFDITFTAEDECNNIDDCMASISFTNNLTVSIDCPDPITIKCSEVITTVSIDSFLLAYMVDSQDEFEVTTDFNIDAVDDGCMESFSELVTFTISDTCNNTDECESAITFLPDGQIYIPNAFSPDGDGLDDWFTVYGNESIANVKSLQVYNRWGNLVFEASDFPPNEERQGWDGYYRSNQGDTNVFVYIIEVEDSFGNIFFETGSITVIK